MASTTSVRPAASASAAAITTTTAATTTAVAPSVMSMLRTVERVLFRDAQRTALLNARSAVLENELKAFDRAEAHASLRRLTSVEN